MENKPKNACCTAGRPPSKEQPGGSVNGNGTPVGSGSGVVPANDMISLPGGVFVMGTRDSEGFPDDGEGPVREVSLSPFYIAPTTVTNLEFSAFIEATAYKTDAERFGWSFVFYGLLPKEELDKHPQAVAQTPWWCAIPGAKWDRPEGPATGLDDRMDHPVVHVSWNDSMAYCAWARKRLPTEEEWEYAARGGLVQKKYPWGDELTPGGEHRCNIWQGVFPTHNTLEDGFLGTAPARYYKPNDFGLYNMAGNVWEWCSDWFNAAGEAKVIRGGSFLCHHSYCNRYRVAARSSNTPDSSASNVGFRCAM